MVLKLFNQEGYEQPELNNKYCFCFKHPDLIEEVIESLSKDQVKKWKQRFRTFPNNHFCTSDQEYGALMKLDSIKNLSSEGGWGLAFSLVATSLHHHNHSDTFEKIVSTFKLRYGS